MEVRLEAIMASLTKSRTLLASSAQRLGVKEHEGQVATMASVATMTTSLFAPDPVCERPETKPSSPSFVSTHRVVPAGAVGVTPTMDAHEVFDAMSTRHEMTMSSIIRVSVSHVIYPVTEDVLRQVFEMYGYGVTTIVVFQGRGWVEASVQLQSGHEAVRARDALHGRNIYDGCCNLSIKCMPTPNLPATPSPTVVNATTSTRVVAPMSPTTVVNRHVVSLSNPSTGTASTGAQVFDKMFGVSNNKEGEATATFQVFSKDMMHDRQPKNDVDSLVMEDHDGVLTHVGGMSIFFELDLKMTGRAGYDTDAQQCLLLGSSHVLSVKGSYSATPLQWLLQEKYKMCPLFGKIPQWRRSGFSPGQDGTYGTHRVFGKGSPCIRNSFSPRHYEQPNVGIMPSWRRGGFSPGVHVVFHKFSPDWQGKLVVCTRQEVDGCFWFERLRVFRAKICSCRPDSHEHHKVTYSAAQQWDPGILQALPWQDGKSAVLAMELYVQWDPGIIHWLFLDNINLYETYKATGYETMLHFLSDSPQLKQMDRVFMYLIQCPLLDNLRLDETSKVGMSRVQKFEQLEALQRACSRYSIAASYIPIWNSSTCARLFSTSSSAWCFTRGAVHSVHIFPGKEFYFESTSLHILQVANVFDYQCLMGVLVTYKSAQTFQVDFSLVDEAIAAISFELEVKASIQMYCTWYPAIWSIISEEVTKLVAEQETEICCKASRLGSCLHDTAADLAFVRVIWKYQIGQWDSFFEERMVHMNQQEASLGCYFHPQSRLFGFAISQSCNTPDGMPWDPGGINRRDIHAIAWGQAMICRGGSVTPDMFPGPQFGDGLRTRSRPNTSILGD